jgi:hypothetical protein
LDPAFDACFFKNVAVPNYFDAAFAPVPGKFVDEAPALVPTLLYSKPI